MMRPAEGVSVYLCRQPVDFRKSIDGLSAVVEQFLGLDPFGDPLFVFVNRRRDKIKVLYWGAPGQAWSWRRGETMDP